MAIYVGCVFLFCCLQALGRFQVANALARFHVLIESMLDVMGGNVSLCIGRAAKVLDYSTGSNHRICKGSPFLAELQTFTVYTNCSDPRLHADACPSFPGRTGFIAIYESKMIYLESSCTVSGLQLHVLNGAPSLYLSRPCSKYASRQEVAKRNELLIKHYIGLAKYRPDEFCSSSTPSVTGSSGLDGISSKWTYDGPK